MITLSIPAPKGDPSEVADLSKILANPQPMLNVAGRSVGSALKAHFKHKQETEPNKLGGKRTNFWADVGRSVSAPTQTSTTSVEVSIDHVAINQKVHGGTIRPKAPRKAIAIPIDPSVYGKMPSTCGIALALVYAKKNGKVSVFLAAAETQERKKYQYGGTQATLQTRYSHAVIGKPLFLLLKSVTQKADPTALPKDAVLQTAAEEGAQAYINSQIEIVNTANQ